MIWYNISKIENEYHVIKTVETKNGIGTTTKFNGTKTECEKYCKDHNIELGTENKKKIKSN